MSSTDARPAGPHRVLVLGGGFAGVETIAAVNSTLLFQNKESLSNRPILGAEPTRVLKHDETFAVFNRYGDVIPIGLGEQGLYHLGTRHLSESGHVAFLRVVNSRHGPGAAAVPSTRCSDGSCSWGSWLCSLPSGGSGRRTPGRRLNMCLGVPGKVVEVQDGAVKKPYVARQVSGEEKATWWERAVAVWPHYAEYQERTDREIPVFVLEPVTD